MWNCTDTAFLNDGNGTGSTIADVSVVGGAVPVQPGASVTLIDGTVAGTLASTRAQGLHGATLTYDWTLDATSGLTATPNSVQINPRTKALSEDWLGDLALTTQGADLVVGQGMGNAASAAHGAGDNGFGAFAALSGTPGRDASMPRPPPEWAGGTTTTPVPISVTAWAVARTMTPPHSITACTRDWAISGTSRTSLDLYGKYFWTRQQGDSVTLSTNDPVKFKDADADSRRLRFGARFAYAVNEYVSPCIGAAYEHEFEGRHEPRRTAIPLTRPRCAAVQARVKSA